MIGGMMAWASGQRLRRAVAGLATLAASGAVIATIPAAIGTATWLRVHELQETWSVEGPPCPVPPGPDAGLGPLKESFPYLDATYSYGRAQAYCADIPKPGLWAVGSYQVCQFNNPGAIQVETRDGVRRFGPLLGHRATVTVRDGAASCVVGGAFDGR